jgi:hypothetical protein
VIKTEAFPFTRYGTLDGQVTEVSDDAIEDEKLGLLFTARIAVPNPYRVKGLWRDEQENTFPFDRRNYRAGRPALERRG